MTTSRTRKSGSSTRSTAKKNPSSTKTATTKAAATKTSTKKTAAKKTSGSRRRASAPRAEAKPKPKPAQVASAAADQLSELTSKQVEGVTGISRNDNGWIVEIEVVEVRRIPDTTDVLAQYEVTLDESGALEGYRRLRRYARGVPRED